MVTGAQLKRERERAWTRKETNIHNNNPVKEREKQRERERERELGLERKTKIQQQQPTLLAERSYCHHNLN
jgi:hypothetical protein